VPLPGADRVHALAAAPDGAVWCGTENGLVRVLPNGGTETFPALAGRDLGTVTAVAVDREGRVWAGSGSSFTGVYRRDDGGWVHLDAIDGYVHRISSDSTGALWFAALNAEGGSMVEGRGAWSFSGGTFRPAPANVELPSRRVYDVVARDPAGVLWFATLKGLAAYEGPDRVAHYTPSSGLLGERVWCLCAGSDGSLWVGYQQERGATRLSSGRMEHFGVEQGLCDGNVWAIVEGRREVFWFATESGVSRYDGVRWSCFRDEEGLGLAPIWPLLPMADGSLWVGTLGAGLVHLVPGDALAPKTRFTSTSHRARVGEQVEVGWAGTDTWYDTPARDLWFRWRLDGGRWSDASPGRRVVLDPGPGRHVLQVQAIDRFGNAETPPAAVEIVVSEDAPRLWPLYAGTGLLLLALGFLIGRRGRPGSA
jgi:ligand-binding sensor domain-containing protein